ncbi:MAG: hypothetical protein Solumvirus5_24 [Solumvirus sp.]|uniref:Uncharacterized protein n=1 Tax=Solumvirus sp. TaxID=2487773 RepID=A0A3G5AGN7_9VIRU|nr:MAG: hypothetical protein Solumvirus5_24 [Solumvirus sp.]
MNTYFYNYNSGESSEDCDTIEELFPKVISNIIVSYVPILKIKYNILPDKIIKDFNPYEISKMNLSNIRDILSPLLKSDRSFDDLHIITVDHSRSYTYKYLVFFYNRAHKRYRLVSLNLVNENDVHILVKYFPNWFIR